MCGIVGVISKQAMGLTEQHTTTFSQMLFADQLRGTDGTGIFFNGAKGLYKMKVPREANELIGTKEYNEAIAIANKEGHFIIGHNRAATKGNQVWKNTHPFTEKHITLIHNGTLVSHKNLDKDLEVDSHAICKHMSIHGYKKTLETIDGAFALVWVDENEGTINLARNYQRPLYLMETNTAWIICSEEGLGKWIADRNNMHVKESFQLETENVYTFSYADFSKYEKKEVSYHKWYFQGFPKQNNKEDNKVVRLPNKTYKHSETIKFSPKLTDRGNAFSSLIWDDKQNQLFLIGTIEEEKDSEVRVYGDYKYLALFVSKTNLEGEVYGISTKGQKTTYRLTSVREEVKDVTPKVEYCDLCAIELTSENRIKRDGQWICKECDGFITNHPDRYYGIGGVC